MISIACIAVFNGWLQCIRLLLVKRLNLMLSSVRECHSITCNRAHDTFFVIL